ncbi:hypothetical protein ABU186_10790 (plasmid) [Weissella paramesenteroides]
MLKTVLKVLLASTLILGGIAVGGTIFAAKGIDKAGTVWKRKSIIKSLNR